MWDKLSGEGKTALSSAKSGGMIIWLEHFTGDIREIGVILTLNGESRQIYLTDSKTARYENDQPFVDANQDVIN